MEFEEVLETDNTTGFGSKCKTAIFNTLFYLVCPFFVVVASKLNHSMLFRSFVLRVSAQPHLGPKLGNMTSV